jgi:hypothetical protein
MKNSRQTGESRENHFFVGQTVDIVQPDEAIETGEILGINQDRAVALIHVDGAGHVRTGFGPIGDLVEIERLRSRSGVPAS